jgi:hypothetical protein
MYYTALLDHHSGDVHGAKVQVSPHVWHTLISTWDKDTDQTCMSIDGGAPHCGGSGGLANLAADTASILRLGCSSHGDGYPFHGEVASALYFDDAMSAADQTKLDATMRAAHFGSAPAPTETRTPVAWMSGVNVDVSTPGYLLKTGGGSGGQGANGGYSAGAVSTQEITYTVEPQGVSFKCDASLTATPNYPAAGMLLGLGYADSGQHYKDIEYAIYCDVLGTPPFQVYEGSGGSTVPVFTDHTTITSNDEFKVQVTGNVVQYFKNNVLLYESNRPVPQFPLRVDTSIRNDGCAFTDVAIFSGTAVEIEVQDAVLSTTDVNAAVAGGASPGFVGSYCIDDDLTNFCHTAGSEGSGQQPWLELDLGSVRSVTSVKIWNRADYPDRLGNHELLVSLDGASWTICGTYTAPSVAAQAAGTVSVPFEEVCVAQARYVKIQLRGVRVGNSKLLNLAEVKVFGL